MKNLFIVCLAALTSLTALAADDSADVKALQGTWLPIKAELGGQPMSADLLKTIQLKLDKNQYVATVSGEPDKGTWSVDSTTKPKSMTVIGVEGPNVGKTFPSIYEIKGDTLRICYDLSGTKRPTEFKSTAGTKLYLVTYNRKK
jgi:uncharacterized protein (TIGR03067 family)